MLIWGLLKLRNRRWRDETTQPWGFVKLSKEWTGLEHTLSSLEGKIGEGRIIEEGATAGTSGVSGEAAVDVGNGLRSRDLRRTNDDTGLHESGSVELDVNNTPPNNESKRWTMEWNCGFSVGRA